MTNEAWNKVVQTHDTFKKIIAPLKEHLDIDFGYMIVFNDGRYYQIIENLECLHKWVTNVETSHIFCARNVTTYFDEPYNFTIWPEEATCKAMEIYKEYGMWNGVTVSRVSEDYTELYWFTKANAEDNWHKWFIRNKLFLLKFIKIFCYYTEDKLLKIKSNISIETFREFKCHFDLYIPNSKFLSSELSNLKKTIKSFYFEAFLQENPQTILSLTHSENNVLSMICYGYSYKCIAQKLGISERTVKFHVQNIKIKTGINSKSALAVFANQNQIFLKNSIL